MKQEDAEQVVRTVHAAATQALQRLKEAPTATTAQAQRACVADALAEFDATVAKVFSAWVEMAAERFEHPRIAPFNPIAAFGAFTAVSKDRDSHYNQLMLGHIKESFAISLKQLADTGERNEPSGNIGARPSAGPSFYEEFRNRLYEHGREQAALIAETQHHATARSGPSRSGPYDDLREPWYRRLLRRNRGHR